MRQQSQKTAHAPNIALADFIRPKTEWESDYLGLFCVTTGFGVDEKAKEFETKWDYKLESYLHGRFRSKNKNGESL